jgi:hypothetical protein
MRVRHLAGLPCSSSPVSHGLIPCVLLGLVAACPADGEMSGSSTLGTTDTGGTVTATGTTDSSDTVTATDTAPTDPATPTATTDAMSEPVTTGDPTSGDTTSEPVTTGDPTGDATTDSLTSSDTSTTAPSVTCGNGVLEQGELCDDGDDDETDECTSLCEAPTCDDGLRSGDETDVDCGGSCPGCGAGQTCGGDDDCEGDECEAGHCAAVCAPWARQFGSGSVDTGSGVAVDADDNILVTGYLGVLSIGLVKKLDAAGEELWSTQIAAADGYIHTYSITTDAADNVYVTGEVLGELDGNPSLGGGLDAFLIKYDPAGAKLWTRQFGTNGSEGGIHVTTDGAGDVIVCGRSDGVLDGNPQLGGFDAFVIKFDPQGVKKWARTIGSASDDLAYSVAADQNSAIVIVGTADASFDGNPAPGNSDGFVAKYDASGAKQWSRQLGTPNADVASAVAIDGADAIHVVGHVNGSLDGNPWLGGTDAFLRKYDGAGKEVWTRQFGTDQVDMARDVVIDSAGAVLVGGTTRGALDGNTNLGSSDLFAVNYAADGSKQWSRQIGTTDEEFAGYIAALASRDPVLVGYTKGKFAEPNAGGYDIIAALLCVP